VTGFELRLLLKALILPPGGPLVVGLIGLLLALRRPRVGLALCAIAIGSLWILSMPIVADALARAAEAGYPALDPAHLTAEQARAQAIVIIGGGLRHNAPEVGADAPSTHADLRLVEGAKIARATGLPVAVSGSTGEAAAMRRFLEEDLQVPVTWVESVSTNTHENAVFSARLLRPKGIERIILVTSAAHVPRATAEFQAAGFTVSAAPAEMWTWDERGARAYVPSMLALSRSQVAFYEWAGRLLR
jgi:uncharacterized SAM-binding protein YcdF (DUF218 family)